jgi:prephenate dehydrogenase
MINSHICIVGLGLMGGSLAKALHGKVTRLTGIDLDAATRQAALADGVCDLVTGDLSAGMQAADLLILATPVRTILHLLQELPRIRASGCLVLDLGSTKQAICEAMSALPPSFSAIGGHPMCGKEAAGYQAATPELYQRRVFVLVRTGRTTTTVETLALEVIAAMGAAPVYLFPEEHDRLVAAVSHLPYILANALLQRSAAEDPAAWRLSASGFRDVTRLAGSDPRMILDILLTNRQAVAAQLAAFQEELGEVARLLDDSGSEAALLEWLEAGQRLFLSHRRQKSGRPEEADA